MPAGRPPKAGMEYAIRWAKAHGSTEVLSYELVGHGATFPEHATLQGVLRALARAGILVESRQWDERSKIYWMDDKTVEQLMKEVHGETGTGVQPTG